VDNRTFVYHIALYPAFDTCSSNVWEGLVKPFMCSDIPGCWVDVWRSVAFLDKLGALPITTTEQLSG